MKRVVRKKNISIPSQKKWKPLTNSNIRQLMKKGGTCGAGLCGDVSLQPFDGCKRPEWGIADFTKPMCM